MSDLDSVRNIIMALSEPEKWCCSGRCSETNWGGSDRVHSRHASCPTYSENELIGYLKRARLAPIKEERGEYIERISNAERGELLTWMQNPNGSSNHYGNYNSFHVEAVEGGGLLFRFKPVRSAPTEAGERLREELKPKRVSAGEKDRQMRKCWDNWPDRPKQFDPALKAAYFAGYMDGEEMEAKNAGTENLAYQIAEVRRVIESLRNANGSIHGIVVDEVRRSTAEWLEAALDGRLDPDDARKGTVSYGKD